MNNESEANNNYSASSSSQYLHGFSDFINYQTMCRNQIAEARAVWSMFLVISYISFIAAVCFVVMFKFLIGIGFGLFFIVTGLLSGYTHQQQKKLEKGIQEMEKLAIDNFYLPSLEYEVFLKTMYNLYMQSKTETPDGQKSEEQAESFDVFEQSKNAESPKEEDVNQIILDAINDIERKKFDYDDTEASVEEDAQRDVMEDPISAVEQALLKTEPKKTVKAKVSKKAKTEKHGKANKAKK